MIIKSNEVSRILYLDIDGSCQFAWHLTHTPIHMEAVKFHHCQPRVPATFNFHEEAEWVMSEHPIKLRVL